LRKTGASYVTEEDDLTLDSLAKDIEVSREEALTSEAELAALSPVGFHQIIPQKK